MSKALNAFAQDITPLVSGCPDSIIEKAILNACIEFCQRTQSWRTTETETVIQHSFPLTVSTPANAKLHRVLSVTADGVALASGIDLQLDESQSSWRDGTGQPVEWLMANDDELIVTPLPESNMQLGITACYHPARTAASVPDYLYDAHAEIIASGALARLLSMRGAAWTEPNLAALHAGRFAEAIRDTRSDYQRSLSGAHHRVKAYFC